MNYKKNSLGFDRFMALRWVDMALELSLANIDEDIAFHQLREWLSIEITGRETARKTATQTRRLWLVKHDEYHELRQRVVDNNIAKNHAHWPLLHYGLALNVFPLLRDVCQTTGRLLKLQATCHRKDIHQRIQEKYGNPASTSTATDRVFQTLVDWGLLIDRNGELLSREILIDDLELTQWLVAALFKAQAIEKIALVDLIKTPELLGISFENLRAAIRDASFLRIERILNTEMVLMVEEIHL